MPLNPGLTNTISGTTNTKETTGLLPIVFDYISADYSGASTDVYTYKSGGAGGSTVATITVVWTSSSKLVLSTVIRT